MSKRHHTDNNTTAINGDGLNTLPEEMTIDGLKNNGLATEDRERKRGRQRRRWRDDIRV